MEQRILEKSHELIMKYGIRSVSMDDIAGALGISKKTLYKYYADKDTLVEAVIKDTVSCNQSQCILDRDAATDAVHEIFLALEMMQAMFANMNPTVIYDLEKFHPKAFSLFQKHKYEFLHKAIKENLQRGIEEGFYRPDINVDIMTKLRLDNMMLVFNQNVFPKTKYSLVEVATAITEHFLYGLATIKGHKHILKFQQNSIKKALHEKN